MKRSTFALLILFTVSAATAFTQPSLSKMKTKLQSQGATLEKGLDFKLLTPTQASISFGDDFNVPQNEAEQWISNHLQLRGSIDALTTETNTLNKGNIITKKLHQFYKGIKVEHGVVNVTTKEGHAAMMQLEFYPIADNFNIRPLLSEGEALQKAIDFTAAKRYEWSDKAWKGQMPKGELVIVKNYEQENEVCLAYKFQILTLIPVSAAYVYVNASTGKIELNDPLIKHVNSNNGEHHEHDNRTAEKNKEIKKTSLLFAPVKPTQATNILSTIEDQPLTYSNSVGSAATRYNGIQYIYTDNNSGVPGKPYRLRETRNGMNIETYNFRAKPWNATVDFYAAAIDFVDNDNNWTDAEYNNANWDNAALNVQFNMQVVSDYWHNVHNRMSWDNANSSIKSYVHVQQFDEIPENSGIYYDNILQNAFWFKGTMSFGDGSGDVTVRPPYTPLDVSAHEVGHAITETTSSLVYQWESGAINEGFSDIWAACITDYAKSIYPLTGENTWRIGEKCKDINTALPGFRDMSNPSILGTPPHPTAYKNSNWRPASLQTCREFSNTDNCGVHSNSGVLNKWFFLITQGESGTNSFGTPYNITGLGFQKTEQIAYLTSLNLTPNASYATTRNVSLNATATLYGNPSAAYSTVRDAWVAVAVDSNIFNMSNTPVFTTNNFTCIAVGKNGVVLAGTNYSGYYKYEANTWQKLPDLLDVRFNDMKADKYGDFWIAQSGMRFWLISMLVVNLYRQLFLVRLQSLPAET
jgi:bacillolysin